MSHEPFHVIDDEVEEDAEARRLREVRSQRKAMAMQGRKRSRDWSLILAIVLAGVAVQLAWIAIERFRFGNATVAAILLLAAMIFLVGSALLVRRFGQLSKQA